MIVSDDTGQIYQLNIRQQSEQLLPQLTETDFLAIDGQGKQLGIRQDQLFWGEYRTALEGNVHFAQYLGQHLIIHHQTAHSHELQALNNKLEIAYRMPLPAKCEFVSSIAFQDSELQALCTQVNPDDKDVVLISSQY